MSKKAKKQPKINKSLIAGLTISSLIVGGGYWFSGWPL